MRTLYRLKELAAALTGATNASSIQGHTIDEVIEYINQNLAITASSVVLTDTSGKKYDVTVSTSGELVVSAKD